eukprot:TRINITY_DN1426_c0_g1_i1.p1 TRINITY_DN1426_c0_g1~~TRINITY_DN1426_c0_g1_i1.p1  ORF type:complete len:151 (-),score=20.39 TRINITY_DN1426_c0_g1_i1:1-453(-)
MVDKSEQMLSQAEKKSSMIPKQNIKLSKLDAQRLPFQNESFDTVIDTFGLCSVPDPVKFLNEMGRVCKKDGEILLLEHGIGKNSIVNYYLNSRVNEHADRWGCEWNKNIQQIVTQSNLSVIEKNRTLFGTTYYYVLSPNASQDNIPQLNP